MFIPLLVRSAGRGRKGRSFRAWLAGVWGGLRRERGRGRAAVADRGGRRPGRGAERGRGVVGGGSPNPFSRSFADDYNRGQPAFAFGAAAAYAYPRIWGSFSAVGTWLGGPDDGGPLAAKAPDPNRTETPRVYLTWTNYLRVT